MIFFFVSDQKKKKMSFLKGAFSSLENFKDHWNFLAELSLFTLDIIV